MRIRRLILARLILPRLILPRLALAGSVGLALSTSAAPALANGKFPEAGQLVVAPDDPSHLAVRTTFGVLDSQDGGQSWQWICEAAVGYENYEPPLALAADGALLMALDEGVRRSVGGCVWAPSAGALAERFVVDLSVSKADPQVAVAITFDAAQVLTELWRSSDGGASWAPHGTPLPAALIGYTLDLAPSDPTTIYLSGLTGDPPQGVAVRSFDDGASWETIPIPGSDLTEAPFIGAMDAGDDATFYVRLAGEEGRLLGTFDAGSTWTELFVGQGFMRGLAVSPDGSQVLLGGEKDGTWRADVPPKAEAQNPAAWTFEQVSEFTPFCLTWLPDGEVLACGHVFFNDGIGVARSSDAGATFDTAFCFGEIDEVLSCEGTDLTATCAAELDTLDDQVPPGTCGSTEPPPPPPQGGAGGAGGQGGASLGTNGGGEGEDSGCQLGRGRDRTVAGWLIALLLVGLGRRRR